MEVPVAKGLDVFAVNQRISHSVYGLGTIREIDHRLTTIDFDENGRRKFVTSMVQLEPSDIEAPKPPPKKGRSKKTLAATAKA